MRWASVSAAVHAKRGNGVSCWSERGRDTGNSGQRGRHVLHAAANARAALMILVGVAGSGFVVRVLPVLCRGDEFAVMMGTQMPGQRVAAGSKKEQQQRKQRQDALAVSGGHGIN